MKNTEAKFKLSSEVHKHHTYYSLTKNGDHLLRYLSERDLIEAYIDYLRSDEQAFKIVKLAEELNADHALTYAKLTKTKTRGYHHEIGAVGNDGIIRGKKTQK